MTYEIRIKDWRGEVLVETSRKRVDHAKLAAKKLAYEYLSYGGLLDRSIAHEAMSTLDNYNACDCKALIKLGPFYSLWLRKW